MHSRLARTVLAVLATTGLLTSAAVSTSHGAPAAGRSGTSASAHQHVQPSGVFGWD